MANDLVKGNGHGGSGGGLTVGQSILRSLSTRRGSQTETALWQEEGKRMAIADAANMARQATHVRMDTVDKEHEVYMAGMHGKIRAAASSSEKAILLADLSKKKYDILREAAEDESLDMEAVNKRVARIDAILNKSK
jgi:hypothetical protein